MMEKKEGSKLILIKHAIPTLEPSKAAKEWRLGDKGKAQASLLADQMKFYLPFSLYSSEEPKAYNTAEIISTELGLKLTTVKGLEEIDRPVLPLLSQQEHRDLNKGIFEEPERPVIGKESANQALSRFNRAIRENVEKILINRNVVIVSQGTVISLFVEKYNKISAFELWKRLSCASFVELDFPGYRLRRIIENSVAGHQ
jgi:broad specificity phosphatase PhoE